MASRSIPQSVSERPSIVLLNNTHPRLLEPEMVVTIDGAEGGNIESD